MGKLSPHWAGNGLMKQIPSVQAEAWLILSESQQVLACPLGSGQTYEPEMGQLHNNETEFFAIKQ